MSLALKSSNKPHGISLSTPAARAIAKVQAPSSQHAFDVIKTIGKRALLIAAVVIVVTGIVALKSLIWIPHATP
jgi:hypothetical protein